jgi:ureidoacrylate peracid hydrolase
MMHEIDIPDWARAEARNPVNAVDPHRTALIVVDMQNAFLRADYPVGNPSARGIIPGINRLAEALRPAGGMVVFLQHSISDAPRFALAPWQRHSSPLEADGGYLLEPGKVAHDLDDALDRDTGDELVLKYRFSAFLPNSSDLHDLLQSRGSDTILITGTVTNVCCESTARDGYMMGYRIIFVSDGTAAFTDLEHNATLLTMTTMFGSVLTIDETIGMIGTGRTAAAL